MGLKANLGISLFFLYNAAYAYFTIPPTMPYIVVFKALCLTWAIFAFHATKQTIRLEMLKQKRDELLRIREVERTVVV